MRSKNCVQSHRYAIIYVAEYKREVSRKYNLRQKDIAQYLTKLTTYNGGGIKAQSPHFPLSDFDLDETGFTVKRDVRSPLPPGAFVQTMPQSGYRGAFTRDSRSRLPIRKQTTIGAAEMLGASEVRDAVQLMAADSFNYEFERQYNLSAEQLLEHK